MDIKDYLEGDEVVVWSGRPSLPQAFKKSLYLILAFASIFGSVTGGFIFLSFGRENFYQGYTFTSLLPLIFGAIPLIVTLSILIWDIKRLRKTQYYLTDKNIIVVNNMARKNKLRKKKINTVKEVDLKFKLGKNGYGNIIFEKDLYHSQNTCTGNHTYKVKDGFYFMGLENASYVYDLYIRQRA